MNFYQAVVKASASQFARRSSHWPKVRGEYLEKHPTCEVCGGTDHMQVHHVKPYHLFPNLELDPTNFIGLCEHPPHNCHFIFGHFMDWKSWNVEVWEAAKKYREQREARPYLRAS